MKGILALTLITTLNAVFPGAQSTIYSEVGHGQVFRKQLKDKRESTAKLLAAEERRKQRGIKRLDNALRCALGQPIKGHYNRTRLLAISVDQE